MKKYIRTLSLLLTAVLTISLTGCGSSDADGGKDRKGLMAAKELSGVWTDESGNILRLDTVESTYTSRMQYIACSKEAMSSGTVVDKQDGKGVYLFLNGFAYPRLDVGGRSLELFFTAGDTQSPDGSFSGVFYKDGKADEYADIDKKDFVSQDGHMWYFDGVQYYALPEGYTVKDDGFAYDENGNMFAAGKKTAPYNPADDWGEGWAENWEEKK